MKFSDLKTADGVPFCEIDGDVYEPSETGVRVGRVHRLSLSGWETAGRCAITASVNITGTHVYLDVCPEAWYADRAIAYRKHIELVQNAANKLVAKAIAEMGGGQ